MRYIGQTGKTYFLKARLGAGGEGAVYSLYEEESLVAKIYRPGKFHSDSERRIMERKLKAMIAMKLPPDPDGVTRLAWPQDLLYDNHVLAGFVMPKLDTTYKLFDIYRAGTVRTALYPNYTWKYAVQFAYHLAWIVARLHSRGIVIGDFNQNNIAIDRVRHTVLLIDCDSFDITDTRTGEHFPCTVGLPEMLAPELQNVGALSNGRFTKESDNFSLAIHIFRLLMDNADPFGGVVTVNGSSSAGSIPQNRAVLRGECVYVRRVWGKRIPDWSADISILPADIRRLFRKTFCYTARSADKKKDSRATAEEWCAALKPLGDPPPNPRLKTCRKNKLHVYPVHNKTCPWCRLEKKRAPVRKRRRHRREKSVNWYFAAGVFGLAAAGAAVSALQGVSPAGAVHALIAQIPALFDSPDVAQPAQESYLIPAAEEESAPVQKTQPQTQTQTQGAVLPVSEYILPDSSSRYLTEEDLKSLSQTEVCLARNEIFARYGRKFQTAWIREYFLGTSWYEERYEPAEFDAISNDIFNEYEKENIRLIVAYEAKMGYS